MTTIHGFLIHRKAGSREGDREIFGLMGEEVLKNKKPPSRLPAFL